MPQQAGATGAGVRKLWPNQTSRTCLSRDCTFRAGSFTWSLPHGIAEFLFYGIPLVHIYMTPFDTELPLALIMPRPNRNPRIPPEETVYNLIPPPVVDPEVPPMYRSKVR